MTEEAPAVEGQVAGAAPEAQGQAEPTSWYASAEDDIKGYIQNKGWDDPIKAVTSYKELEKFQGASPDQILKLPKEGEPMDEIYNRLGRPKTAEEYAWESKNQVSVDENRMSMYKEVAHKAGITQDQFEALATADSEFMDTMMQKHAAAEDQKQTAELTQLRSEWGTNFDERAELGRRFVAKNIPDDMDKEGTLNAIEGAIGTAAMLKLFANAGEKSGVREDTLPSGDGDRPFGYTREQATADKKELMQTIQADPARLGNYNTGKGPDIDKIKKLNQIIAG